MSAFPSVNYCRRKKKNSGTSVFGKEKKKMERKKEDLGEPRDTVGPVRLRRWSPP